jgi:hypothetical protein
LGIGLPRAGYKSLTLSEDLYSGLTEKARLYGKTSQKLIEFFLAEPSELMPFDEPFSQKGLMAGPQGFEPWMSGSAGVRSRRNPRDLRPDPD